MSETNGINKLLHFSANQLKLLNMLGDGERHSLTHLKAVCGGCSDSSLFVRVTKLRKEIRKLNPNLNILRESDNVGGYYRLVRIFPATIDDIK